MSDHEKRARRDEIANALKAYRAEIVEADEWRPLADHVLALLDKVERETRAKERERAIAIVTYSVNNLRDAERAAARIGDDKFGQHPCNDPLGIDARSLRRVEGGRA